MKNMSKKGAELSLQFLLGLIVTGFLILFAYSSVSEFFYSAPLHKDVIDNWVEEIQTENRVTQLLPFQNFLDKKSEDVIFIVFNKGEDIIRFTKILTHDFGSDYVSSTDTYSFKKSCSKKQACICSFDLDTSNSYCKSIGDLELNNNNQNLDFALFTKLNNEHTFTVNSKKIAVFRESIFIKNPGGMLTLCEDKTSC